MSSGFTFFEHGSDNVFLKLPHIFKPLQTLNAIILAICVGSTAGSENGVLWFVISLSLLISGAATAVFALDLQDQVMNSISNGSIAWPVVELAYSFIFTILSVISLWLSFSFAGRQLGGTSAGYVAAGLFSAVHCGLYGVPSFMLYQDVQGTQRNDREIHVQQTHPFQEVPYQDL